VIRFILLRVAFIPAVAGFFLFFQCVFSLVI